MPATDQAINLAQRPRRNLKPSGVIVMKHGDAQYVDKSCGGFTVIRHMAARCGLIPAQDISRLDKEQFKAFIQLEDPCHWPPGLEHLLQYAELHKREL